MSSRFADALLMTTLSFVSLGVGALLLRADPLVDTVLEIPRLFSLRVTDVIDVADDLEGDRYLLEFEVLNWTNRHAFGLDISFASNERFPETEGAAPFFASASVDSDGRPIGPGSDDGNFPPTMKAGQSNRWSVKRQTSTRVVWRSDRVPLLARDLLAGTSVDACSLIPGCSMVHGSPNVANRETIDDGVSVDNVLDGFVIEVDDWDVGEIFSINWFLLDAEGSPIGVSGFGNAFGFGSGNFRLGCSGRPLWRRSPGSPSESNTGMSTDVVYIFDQSISNGLKVAVEWGTSLTSMFRDPDDNVNDTVINGAPFGDESIFLTPLSCRNMTGTEHVVTATVESEGGIRIENRTVEFEVRRGPNLGKSTTVDTNARGIALFRYIDDGGRGEDRIVARMDDSRGDRVISNEVGKVWRRDLCVLFAGTDSIEERFAHRFAGPEDIQYVLQRGDLSWLVRLPYPEIRVPNRLAFEGMKFRMQMWMINPRLFPNDLFRVSNALEWTVGAGDPESIGDDSYICLFGGPAKRGERMELGFRVKRGRQ